MLIFVYTRIFFPAEMNYTLRGFVHIQPFAEDYLVNKYQKDLKQEPVTPKNWLINGNPLNWSTLYRWLAVHSTFEQL